MVKGTKRKATMEKIAKRASAATTYTKRTYGLHSKVAQLCLLADAQIAVLATPSSSNSNVCFFSFGHTSVDSIVNAYLKGGRPVREEIDDHEDLGICFARKELGLPQWWESDLLLRTKNPEELRRAMNSVLRLLAKIKELRAEDAYTRQCDDVQQKQPPLKKKKKKKSNNNETMEKKTEPMEQTLVLPSGPSEERVKTLDYTVEELDQMMSTCNSFCVPHNNNYSLEIDFDQLVDLDFGFDFETVNNSSHNVETMKMAEPVDQTLFLPNNNSNNDTSLAYGIHDLDTSSVFVDDSLLGSTNSAMNSLASVDGGFVETTTTQEQFQNSTTTSTQEETTNSSALNSVACDDDASALNDEDSSFSDYLTQLLQC